MATDAEHNLPILESDGVEKTTVGNYFVSKRTMTRVKRND